jgi:hypothetical protein
VCETDRVRVALTPPSRFSVDGRSVGAHELAHLCARRIEDVRALFERTLALGPSDFPQDSGRTSSGADPAADDGSAELRVALLRDERDARRAAPLLVGLDLQVIGALRLGSRTAACLWFDPRAIPDDAALDRLLAHVTARMLLSNMKPCIGPGEAGHGWLESGIAHWFEARVGDGRCTTLSFGELVQRPTGTFRRGLWRPGVRRLLGEGAVRPFADLALLQHEQLDLEACAEAFASVEFLLASGDGATFRRLLRRGRRAGCHDGHWRAVSRAGADRRTLRCLGADQLPAAVTARPRSRGTTPRRPERRQLEHGAGREHRELRPVPDAPRSGRVGADAGGRLRHPIDHRCQLGVPARHVGRVRVFEPQPPAVAPQELGDRRTIAARRALEQPIVGLWHRGGVWRRVHAVHGRQNPRRSTAVRRLTIGSDDPIVSGTTVRPNSMTRETHSDDSAGDGGVIRRIERACDTPCDRPRPARLPGGHTGPRRGLRRRSRERPTRATPAAEVAVGFVNRPRPIVRAAHRIASAARRPGGTDATHAPRP